MRMCVQFLLGRGSFAFREGFGGAGYEDHILSPTASPLNQAFPWGSFIPW